VGGAAWWAWAAFRPGSPTWGPTKATSRDLAIDSGLVDTGAIVALLDRSEHHHKHCAGAIGEIEAPLLTCEAVIAETCYLLREIKNAVDAVLENVEKGVFLVPYRVTGKTFGLRRLLKKYAEVPMDFADACLVGMANEYQTGRILTLDRDFRIYRWGKNRPFDLVVEPLSW
jgi:predicted nucleic acid-binding protein